jgi:hypothetical protein
VGASGAYQPAADTVAVAAAAAHAVGFAAVAAAAQQTQTAPLPIAAVVQAAATVLHTPVCAVLPFWLLPGAIQLYGCSVHVSDERVCCPDVSIALGLLLLSELSLLLHTWQGPLSHSTQKGVDLAWCDI